MVPSLSKTINDQSPPQDPLRSRDQAARERVSSQGSQPSAYC